MKDWIYRTACCALLGACATTTERNEAKPEAIMTITEAEAARFSVSELLQMYVVAEEGTALYLSGRNCPAQNARADSLLAGLLKLPPSGERARDYSLSWQNLMAHCGDARIASWFRSAIRGAQDDLTVEMLTKGLLRTRDPVNIEAVKAAAFDTTNSPDARMAMLSLFVEELDLTGEERVALMIESYRQTGEIPGSFVADQSRLLWGLRTRRWREDLLAEVLSDPSRRGAGPLLLTLARETRSAPNGSQWRQAWQTALEVLARHPDANAELKAMIPIAQDVSRYQKD
jgi:hypothetical protein